MDLDQPSSAPRKVKFAPKNPPRRRPKPIERKTEAVNEADEADDDEATQALLKRVHEHLGRRGPKVEKKSAVQVAFDGGVPSTSIRTYGIPRERDSGKSSGSDLKDSTTDDGQILSSYSTAEPDGTSGRDLNAEDASCQKKKKDYIEPWDYHHTCYPTTLPLRRPYSGNPELLDEAEFGKDAMNVEYDENTVNPASELGFLEENKEARMLFLQLPSNLPLDKRSATAGGISMSSEITIASANAKGKAIASSSMSLGDSGASARANKHCGLEELPGGYLGKMLVYKSGAVKLKLGNTLYDVSPGSDCVFGQDVVAINTIDKSCSMLGELNKRAIVTPDIDSLLNCD
ncbi:DNA-directed RNA polymerase III subunit rpc4-like [Cornus florida]|uniref:DNA-directed RNA polymerase III subunit rpc4-like n=1 Tax=Cornus florida TaxID=4283 RepID=UPI0028A0DEE5|nr:DNA-directed RNA polymerase III subunit rpc4-like [Cornus florida]